MRIASTKKRTPNSPSKKPGATKRRLAPVQRESPGTGLFYQPGFVSNSEGAAVRAVLQSLPALWEWRYGAHRPPPDGKPNRPLLRPVYWFGSWQFACLGYYHPPKGQRHRCVQAEPFPPVLAAWVDRIHKQVRRTVPARDIPAGWRLNTCLVNLYGTDRRGERAVDTARVGEHKDFEPGPVASVSLGERALFQFVQSYGRGVPSKVVLQQWLEDRSLQIFSGARWKERLFHRVQRVERKRGLVFPPHVEGFETRRVNFTFRYVPTADTVAYHELPPAQASDTRIYMELLARSRPFFRHALAQRSGL